MPRPSLTKRISRPIIGAYLAVLGSLIASYLLPMLHSFSGWVWGAFAATVAVHVALSLSKEDENGGNQGASPEEYLKATFDFLNQIASRNRFLPLYVMDDKNSDPNACEEERMPLTEIYIPLDIGKKEDRGEPESAEDSHGLFKRGEGDETATPILNVLIENRKVIVLGDPGGGKTSFIRYLSVCLAGHGTKPEENWIGRLEGWPDDWRDMLPVPLRLQDIAIWFQRTQIPSRKTGLFLEYLRHWLNDMGQPGFGEILQGKLHQGKAILMLDGLDEIAVVDDTLDRIKEMIADLPESFPDAPMIVTCRVLSFQDARWHVASKPWKVFEIAGLNEEKIETFITKWYARMAEVQPGFSAEEYRKSLLHALRSRSELRDMGRNPLLLTNMAMVHTRKGRLPGSRIQLYKALVELLMFRWEVEKRVCENESRTSFADLMNEADLKEHDLLKVMWEIGFQLQSQMQEKESEQVSAGIREHDLLEQLAKLHPEESLDWARKMVEIFRLRAGILVEVKPKQYGFPHQTFQEYFAGCDLSSRGGFVPEAKKLSEQGPYWWETLLLAVGNLVNDNRIEAPLFLVGELCPAASPEKDDSMGWRNIWLAGECLLAVGLRRARQYEGGKNLVKQVPLKLAELVGLYCLSPRDRAEAATVLGALGDPRDLEAMMPVGTGPFLMGTASNELEHYGGAFQSRIQNRETPLKPIRVDSFRISKYPVTNSQYARFVAGTGHSAPRSWDGQTPPAGLVNHPVVAVSWHDAVAYCNWLGEKRGEIVRLPTEAEWEKAARGENGRIYPWGDTFDKHLCNMAETGIGKTSPVGVFPAGESPYGCSDMAGNVWEWTSTLWGEKWKEPTFAYPYDAGDGRENPDAPDRVLRVVRGGAFDFNRRDVRCAYRNRFDPDYRLSDIGFRVVSPGLCPLNSLVSEGKLPNQV